MDDNENKKAGKVVRDKMPVGTKTEKMAVGLSEIKLGMIPILSPLL